MVDWLCTYGTCLQSRATPPDKKDELCEKMMNFGFKMMNCVLEMANFVLEMMNFALDLMNFVPAPGKIPMRHSGKQILASFVDNRMSIAKADSRPQPEFVIENDEFFVENDEFCNQNLWTLYFKWWIRGPLQTRQQNEIKWDQRHRGWNTSQRDVAARKVKEVKME